MYPKAPILFKNPPLNDRFKTGKFEPVPPDVAGARGPTCIASVALLKAQPHRLHEVWILRSPKAIDLSLGFRVRALNTKPITLNPKL